MFVRVATMHVLTISILGDWGDLIIGVKVQYCLKHNMKKKRKNFIFFFEKFKFCFLLFTRIFMKSANSLLFIKFSLIDYYAITNF